jgi:hypothetical protein
MDNLSDIPIRIRLRPCPTHCESPVNQWEFSGQDRFLGWHSLTTNGARIYEHSRLASRLRQLPDWKYETATLHFHSHEHSPIPIVSSRNMGLWTPSVALTKFSTTCLDVRSGSPSCRDPTTILDGHLPCESPFARVKQPECSGQDHLS